jgi:hypothetical protein
LRSERKRRVKMGNHTTVNETITSAEFKQQSTLDPLQSGDNEEHEKEQD